MILTYKYDTFEDMNKIMQSTIEKSIKLQRRLVNDINVFKEGDKWVLKITMQKPN